VAIGVAAGGGQCVEKGTSVNALDQGFGPEKPDPKMWERPEMQAAVTARDFTKVFRLLQRVGLSQQRIAALTGQSQPEVSAIVHGRKVMAYDVLLRVADGLGVPRGLAGLSSCGCGEPRADQGAVAVTPVEDPAAAEAGRLGGAASEHGADGVGELAVLTAAGFTRVGLRSVEPSPEGAVRRYLEEGRTMAVIGLVDLARSRLPGIGGGGAWPAAVLVEFPSVAEITGKEPASAPLILVAGGGERRESA
jgi:transcriptional regulator with XRE-family HTH domain